MKETFFWTFSSDAISTLSDLTSEGFEVDWTVRSSSDAMTSGFVIQGGHDLSFKDCSFRLLRTSLRLQSYCKHQSCDVSYGSMPVAH